MKRKRGNKKGKSKKHALVGVNEAVSNVANSNMEDNSGLDDYDKDESDSEMETETPSSTGTDQQVKIACTDSTVLDKPKPPERLVYGRVKVKIKTSKNLESQLTSSDAPTQSDTDKSGQQVGLEKQVVPEKTGDSANSLPEISVGVPSNQSKKAGSIKIKSSRGFSSSSLSPCNNVDKDVSLERSGNEQKRGGDSIREYSPVSDSKPSGQVNDFPRRGPQQNKPELNAALEVIKKVMKMDAAEPFNVPVDPVALGIPDYFDVVDTPMDFGTICSNIENGVKYINAEDVLKDVQYIWGNCYKYNNKGDYILELMKRVKKNFAKYWAAAGLSNEQMQGVENSQSKDAPSGKMQVKGGHSKHKSKKRQKVKRHKDDCLCAICVMMRRRQEREESAQIDEDNNETSDSRLAQELKPEDTSPVESLGGGEGTSSSMDNSEDQDADADVEDKGEEVKREDTEQQQQQPYNPVLEKQAEGSTDNEVTRGDGEISEHSQIGERTEDEHNNRDHHTQTAELGSDTQNETRKEEMSMQHVDETAAVEYQRPKESLDKIQKARICESLRRFENPMLLELCGTLFSDSPKSLWRGPHSLIHRQGSTQSSPIHAAVATFMK